MKFDIISSLDGTTVLYTGSPVYHGTYLKPAYVEFTTIASRTPINWNVGDYVVYSRVGGNTVFKLYSIPQPTKQATSGKYGGGFTYSNVQFFAVTKQLEICPFRDLVIDQGSSTSYHFSTLNSVDTFENVAGIADRISKCLSSFGYSDWVVQVQSGLSGFNETEAREFSVSGGSVLDALTKIYEVWPELGWTYSYDSSTHKNIITIGGANVRSSANTTNQFKYGQSYGLTMIKRTQANRDEMCTRLYPYGSSRNLIARHYNTSDVYEHEKIYVPNLMIPKAQWGQTDSKPDASKAYLENGVSRFGVIPKFVYFDGNEQPEIYPSITETTIGLLKAAKQALGRTDAGAPDYYPSEGADDDRLDEVVSVAQMPDDGLIGDGGSALMDQEQVELPYSTGGYALGEQQHLGPLNYLRETELIEIAAHTFEYGGKLYVSCPSTFAMQFFNQGHLNDMRVVLKVFAGSDEKYSTTFSPSRPDSSMLRWTFKIDDLNLGTNISVPEGEVKIKIIAQAFFGFSSTDAVVMTFTNTASVVTWGVSRALAQTFGMTVRNLGFDMMERAALSGNAMPTVAFKDGACVARAFSVRSSSYDDENDQWNLVLYRGDDTSVGMRFPNTTYPVAAGDHFVLLDIAMPDEYIDMAEQRLYTAASQLLAKLSKVEPFYEPSVDAKVVYNNRKSHPNTERYVLREGKYMYITDADIVGTDQYVIIDTLTINEGESNIPTYRVTLREKKKETFTQSIEAHIQQLTSTSGGTQQSAGQSAGGVGGVSDYNALSGKPTINGVEVSGDKDGYTDYGLVKTTGDENVAGRKSFTGDDIDLPAHVHLGAKPYAQTASRADVFLYPDNLPSAITYHQAVLIMPKRQDGAIVQDEVVLIDTNAIRSSKPIVMPAGKQIYADNNGWLSMLYADSGNTVYVGNESVSSAVIRGIVTYLRGAGANAVVISGIISLLKDTILSAGKKLEFNGGSADNGVVPFIEYDATNHALKVNGNFYATGGVSAGGPGTAQQKVSILTASATLDASMHRILAKQNITLTLPASPVAGDEYIIYNTAGVTIASGSSNIKVFVSGTGQSATGLPNYTVAAEKTELRVVFDGTNWDIFV